MDKQVFQEISNLNFNTAQKLIESKLVVLNSVKSLNLIISCAKVLNKHECKNDKTADELYEFLIEIIKFIEILNEQQLENYLTCMFCIMKFLIDNKYFYILTKMDQIVYPNFINEPLTTNQNNILLKIGNILYNLILKQYDSKCEDISHGRFLDLSSLSLTIYSKILNNEKFIKKTEVYLYFANNLKINNLPQFYKNCIIMLKKYNNNTKSFFKQIIELLHTVTCNTISDSSFIYLQTFYDYTEDVIKEYCNDKCNLFTNTIKPFYNFLCLPDVYLKKNSDDFIKCLEILKLSKPLEVYSICKLIVLLERCWVVYLETRSKDGFIKILSTDLFVQICNINLRVSQLLAESPLKCSVCNNCGVKSDISHAIVIILLNANLYMKLNYPKCLSNRILKHMKQCNLYIKYLKDRSCDVWKEKWLRQKPYIFNIALNYYNNNYEECVQFYMLMFNSYFNYENIEGLKTTDTICSCFDALIDFFIKSNDFKNAFLYNSLYIYLFSSEQSLVMWIKLKVATNNDEYKKITITSVLINRNEEVKKIYSNFNMDAEKRRELLFLELNVLKKRWPCRIPLASVCEELYDVCDSVTMADVFVQIYNCGSVFKCENIPPLVYRTLEQMENCINQNSQLDHQLVIGYLYFIRYKYRLNKITDENLKDMENTIGTLETPEERNEAGSSINDKCDLVPSYENLRLDRYFDVFNNIEKTVNIFDKCITKKNLNEDALNDLQKRNVYDLLVKIAHEYKLHCHKLQSLKTWTVALKLSKILKDNLKILECIGFIIEMCDIKSKECNNLLEDSSEIIKIINNCDDNNVLECLTNFYASIGLSYYFAQEIDEAFIAYNTAIKYFNKLNDKNRIIEIRVNYLHFKLLMLPCETTTEDHKHICMALIHKCSRIIHNCYTDNAYNAELVLTVLYQVTEEQVKMYQWMGLPREMRCYATDITVLAQELIIPLRTSYFLFYLAYADLLTMRMKDCKVKINGMEDILCLSKSKQLYWQKKEQKKSLEIYEDSDTSLSNDNLNDLADKFQEIMLHSSNIKPSASVTGSPMLLEKKFKLPNFLNHSKHCDCFYCGSIEYQELVIMNMYLESELNFREGDTSATQNYWSGAFKVIENIKIKQNHLLRKTNIMLRIDDTVFQTHCTFLLDYTKNLMRSRNFLKAIETNNELYNLIKDKKYLNMYLYNEVLLQKIILEANSSNLFLQPKSSKNILEPDEIDNKIIKTPERRCNTVPVTPINRVIETAIPKRKLPKVVFNLTSDSDEDEEKMIVHAKSTRSRRNMTPKTPAPNIKIYTPASKSTTKKKQMKSEEKQQEPANVKRNLRARTKLKIEETDDTPKTLIPVIQLNGKPHDDSETVEKPSTSNPKRSTRRNKS